MLLNKKGISYKEKKKILHNEILKYKKVLIAYSGGVDSTLLLCVTAKLLGKENVIAATATSPTYTKQELELTKKITAEIGIKHVIFETEEFNNPDFVLNSEKRCYYCKKELFTKLHRLKKEFNCDVIMDGSNYDDLLDYRPGSIAEKEENIATPLKDAFFTKTDIRKYSKELSLITYNYPSLACLSSRIPYNEPITKEKLLMIEKGELFLRSLGFKNVRIRTYDKTARIEVEKEKLKRILKHKDKIISYLKSLGYIYITLDLEGYRTGSMNAVLKK